MGHRPFFVLADHLTRQGIAVLRYDDRGVGKSTGDFGTAAHNDFVGDALSAVDAHTEASILAALRARAARQTRIIVTHRLSAVVDADLILVLDGGRVIQRGTHAELAQQAGLYRTLWEIQHLSDAELEALDV